MEKLRLTKSNSLIGVIRIMLGIMFLMTGVMKISFEEFGAAWTIQLTEAGFPFWQFIWWFVPLIEIIIGATMLVGYYSRIGAVIILPIMLVAIYVHLMVVNPAAFPAQPQAPIMPFIVIAMASMILVKGGGSWSNDLQYSEMTK